MHGVELSNGTNGRREAPADVDGELYRMFLEHGGGDINKWHHYFAIYERHFARFRGTPVSLLEIGVERGGSLGLWRRYFGEAARITGIDIDADCKRHAAPGIEVLIGDQESPPFLKAANDSRGPFDIVIDDGGHTTRQQLVSYETLFPLLRDGGVYLVEDVHTSMWPWFVDPDLGISFLDVATRQAEKLTWWHRDPMSFLRYGKPPAEREGPLDVPDITRRTFSIAFYDSVVVFEKQAVPEPRREVR